LFDTPELGIMGGDETKRRLRGRPSGLVDKLFHPFTSFLSSHHGAEIDRRNGTPVEIGVIRDVFEAFVPDGEQRALFPAFFDVAEKLGGDFNGTPMRAKITLKKFAGKNTPRRAYAYHVAEIEMLTGNLANPENETGDCGCYVVRRTSPSTIYKTGS